jgi:hypothetical protein
MRVGGNANLAWAHTLAKQIRLVGRRHPTHHAPISSRGFQIW